MLTFFCVPKAFEARIAEIQRNAIRSWTSLTPACQVIVCGDDAGCREIVREFGLDHVPDIDRNEFGTPLLSSVFERAQERATHDRLCYANADLIFFPDFLAAIGRIGEASTSCLVVGEATSLDVEGELLEETDYEAVRRRALTSGVLRGRQWIDFFVFSPGAVGRLPDFAVGRPSWDNWMLWRARSMRIPVVDITPSAVVVHQEHGYAHVPHATDDRWEGPEGERNRQLAGGEEIGRFSLAEATHRLTENGLVENDHGFMHRVGVELLLHPRAVPAYRVLRRSYRAMRRTYRRVRDVPRGKRES